MDSARPLSPLKAVVFDMDGVLIDSEPLWREAEIQTFRAHGVPMTEAMCHETMGTRADEVVHYWHSRFPWSAPSLVAVEIELVDRVEALIRSRGQHHAAPGLVAALQGVRDCGLRLGLASSSASRLIRAVLETLGISDRFDVVHSAEHESHGKPHPAVYLHTVASLGVVSQQSLAIEDSIPGMIAAKAANMWCVMIPDPALRGDRRLGLADKVLSSLTEIPDYLASLTSSPPS